MPDSARAHLQRLLGLRLGDALEDLSRQQVSAAGGWSAAMSAAFAAALTAMVARASHDRWAEADGAIAQAEALRMRLCDLAAKDAHAYELARSRLPRECERADVSFAAEAGGLAPPEERDRELAAALDAVALVALQMTEAAADVAVLAGWAVGAGSPDHRADAVVAVLLAEAATRSAAHLLSINLAIRPEDERSERAGAAVRIAARERARAVRVSV